MSNRDFASKTQLTDWVSVIKMTLLVSGNPLFNFPILLRQLGFSLGTVFCLYRGGKDRRGIQCKILSVARWAIRMINIFAQPKIWSHWPTGRPLSLVPVSNESKNASHSIPS